jgi:hypothetical protein
LSLSMFFYFIIFICSTNAYLQLGYMYRTGTRTVTGRKGEEDGLDKVNGIGGEASHTVSSPGMFFF